MTLDMWFKDDIANLLRGLIMAAGADSNSEYQRGYLAAIITVATAFGIDHRAMHSERLQIGTRR